MTNQEYIHINEAVKKWEKTRQTFYNYIHKGLVRTKKINNKVYLYTDDVEQLMNGFIPSSVQPAEVETISEAQEESVPTVKETSEAQDTGASTQLLINVQEDMTRLHKQYYTLKDDILHEVKRTREDVLFDSKRLTKSVEDQVTIRLDKIEQDDHHKTLDIIDSIDELQLSSKKQSFWIAYSSIVAVNLLVMFFM